jgi:hypothetical protein
VQKKKLQVFVSSTYSDLRDERQAAVEAILTAGHIPAGMELFAAGDESQMDVIKRWIDESDVYLLVLGGRYGSIEPKSQKSYIHLEYEYALATGKPLFSVVIEDSHLNEKIKSLGRDALEGDYPQKLKEFRELVLSKMVRFWQDPKDIKISILETLSEISRRDDLVGWIPGDQAVDTATLAEEMARLAKENADLREKLASLSEASTTYNGLTFEQMYKLLSETKANITNVEGDVVQKINSVSNTLGDTEPKLLHALWAMIPNLREGYYLAHDSNLRRQVVGPLLELGLVEIDKLASQGMSFNTKVFELTASGKQFLLRLRLALNLEEVEE